jgi:iron complex transport system substrate-binding protein
MRPSTAIPIALVIFAAVVAARSIFGPGSAPLSSALAPAAPPARIVSLAPSITETLFALGLGDRVVGVTRYCEYPPEAQSRAIVGGFVDPNYEAIVTLRPDLAVLLVIHDEARARLHTLDVPVLLVDHRTVQGILDSFETIGRRCNAQDAAGALVASCRARIAVVERKTAGLPRPRVLISSARELGVGRIESIYAAGRGQWYDELLRLAGGVNAYPDDGIAFPEISPEGILRMDPDVILELVPKLEGARYSAGDILTEWKSIPGLRAVREGRTHLLSGSHVSIPGPRFVDVLEDFARLLHPEADWQSP